MNKIFISTVILIFIFCLTVVGQSKYDYQWIFGNDPDPTPGVEALILDFNGNKRTLYPFNFGETDDQIDFNQASICDHDGKLLYYVNGCAIYDSTFQVMENGEDINPGEVHEEFCRFGIYPVLGGSLLLEDPTGLGVYYLHKNDVWVEDQNGSTDVTFPDLMYSYISYSENKVIKKNIRIDSIRYKQAGYFESIRHENNIDWWVFDFVEDEYGGYLAKFLIDSTGIQHFEDWDYPNKESLNESCSSAGQSCFSPDGSLYARYCSLTGLDVFDFDRETSELSNYRHLDIFGLGENFSGLAISPNSRFIYVSDGDMLMQVDLWEEQLFNGVELVGEYNGTANPFPAKIVWMQIGPDCRIYIVSSNSSESMHYIDSPNEKASACNFMQNGLKFPYSINPGSIPNHPVFRFDGEEVCDSTITSLFNIPIEISYDLDLYPNPTSDVLNIDYPEDLHRTVLSIMDISGMIVEFHEIDYSGSYRLSVDNYKAGIYIVEVISNQTVYSSRFIKID